MSNSPPFDFVELTRGKWFLIVGDAEDDPEQCFAVGPLNDYKELVDYSRRFGDGQNGWRIFDIPEGYDVSDFSEEPIYEDILRRATAPTTKT